MPLLSQNCTAIFIATSTATEPLERHAQELAGIIVEPLVQGAGGMLFHDARVLRHLRAAADRHGPLLIFDEIFTGFGRTGTMFACEAADVTPDIITLSKALTGGTMGLGAAITTKKVFDTFLSDEPNHALMHGPTFMANPLACAAANASLDLFAREPRLEQVTAISKVLARALEPARALPHVRDMRVKGAIGVVELDRIDDLGALRRRFIKAGVFVRPIRNIVYLTPAFTIGEEDLERLTGAVVSVLEQWTRL
jgi:adenosylmethionine---8-amino-7-oxononanoate aminotransferase